MIAYLGLILMIYHYNNFKEKNYGKRPTRKIQPYYKPAKIYAEEVDNQRKNVGQAGNFGIYLGSYNFGNQLLYRQDHYVFLSQVSSPELAFYLSFYLVWWLSSANSFLCRNDSLEKNLNFTLSGGKQLDKIWIIISWLHRF